MIAAIHIENLLFLLFIAIAFFFQLLTKAATKSKKDLDRTGPENRGQPPPRIPRPTRPETDEERVRKFLEALGQPAGSAPPPPVKARPLPKRVVLPHVGPFESTLPPLTTRPPELPREVLVQKPVLARPQQRVFVPKEPTAAFEVHETPAAPVASAVSTTAPAPLAMPLFGVVASSSRSNLLSLLKSNAGLREAVVLREIFGKPKAFSD